MSRKPLVVTSAVTAPRFSMMAFVASVVPCSLTPTSAGRICDFCSTSAMPCMTPSSGARGVVRTLAVQRSNPRSATTSVKVPPMSEAMRTSATIAVLLPLGAGATPAPAPLRRWSSVARSRILERRFFAAIGEACCEGGGGEGEG